MVVTPPPIFGAVYLSIALVMNKARLRFGFGTWSAADIARIYELKGETDKVIDYFYQAVSSDSSNLTYRTELTNLLVKAGQCNEAKEEWQAAARLAKQLGKPWLSIIACQ